MKDPSHPHHISPVKVVLVLLLLAAVVVLVALAGYLPRKEREKAALDAAKEEKSAIPIVTAARVRQAARDTEVVLPGSLSAIVESSIYARAAGYLRKRYVDIGDRVREGQLLAEIDAPELDQQVAQARAAVSQSKQQLSQTRSALVQAQAQRDLAKITAERYTNLLARGAVARQDADTQQSNFRTSEALVDAQQANVRAAEDNVKQAEANLDRVVALQEFKSLKAPFAGVVTVRNSDVGALISSTGAGQGNSSMSPGAAQGAAGNELFRIAQIGTIRILANAPQANVPGIRVGMPAEVTVNEFPGRRFTGKVARTSSSLDPNTRTLLIEVHVPNPDGKLLPGMYGEVHFEGHRDSPPLLVPGDSVIASNTGLQVAVLIDPAPEDNQPQGVRKVHIQKVQAGRDFGPETEVSGELKLADIVVVNPGDDVREGAFVKAEFTNAAPAAQKGAPK